MVVKGQSNNELGVLENAYNVSIKRTVNEVWTASFSLPLSDPKNEFCRHFNYIDITSPSGRYMGLYRIMPAETRKSASDESITYECEHVLSTLLDDVIEGYHQFTNYNTSYVLQSILDLQETKHWQLGEIEFERYFHYSFENENGLLAPLLSIPQPFNETYEFTFDTTVYPWKLNLVKSSNDVKAEIRWGHDMIDFSEVSDPSEIVNHIIPKGSGEGVNQLTIEDVNNGVRYLENAASISEWGKRKYIWIDKRFDDASTLKENAQSLLKQWKDPKISFDLNTVDLSVLEEENDETYFIQHDQTIEVESPVKPLARPLNGVTRIIVDDKEYEARIISEDIADLFNEHDVSYEINNKLDDIATTQANLERKQQVNEAYSQGATNIMAIPIQDNADANHPLILPFVIDDDVVNVNTLDLWFETKEFRAYSTTTEGGGAIVKSTKGGGGTTESTTSGGSTEATSSSGGGTSKSTANGGGSSQTTSTQSFGELSVESEPPTSPDHDGHRHRVVMDGDYWNHSHSVDVPSHSHSFSVPSHTHSVNIPSHSHNVTIPDHTHEIELPDHSHDVRHEIVTLNEKPSSVQIKVDGNVVSFSNTSGDRIDLSNYIEKNNNGKATRGKHEIEILPNSLARIEANLVLRLFIRSHIGTTI
nr:phage tail spike protein [Lentibacillus amyloliquefaciens]